MESEYSMNMIFEQGFQVVERASGTPQHALARTDPLQYLLQSRPRYILQHTYLQDWRLATLATNICQRMHVYKWCCETCHVGNELRPPIQAIGNQQLSSHLRIRRPFSRSLRRTGHACLGLPSCKIGTLLRPNGAPRWR
jgi:hypothetical protein